MKLFFPALIGLALVASPALAADNAPHLGETVARVGAMIGVDVA